MSKEFKIPELGESVESATVARILVSEGDKIVKDQSVVELETDKASTEVPCGFSGTVEKIHVKEGDEVKIGQTLLTLKEEEAAKEEPKTEPEPQKQKEEPPKQKEEDVKKPETAKREEEPVPAAPSTRRFAREIGIDIGMVQGSGPNGRISIDDVKTHARSSGGSHPAAPLPDFSQWGQTERRPMSKVRRLTAEQMVRAWSLIPHAVQFGKADITETEKLREHYMKDAEEAGGHLSLTVILMKTVAGALKKFPQFNASVDAQSSEIIYKQYYNIGIAMDTERGLVVPVIRNADKKSVIELSVELKQLTDKARNGTLTVEDLRGGTLTITNAGALGGETFIPIVNWPEAAILGVARSSMEAVFQCETFTPRLMLPLTLSYDHRLIDGADGVRFLRWIIEALEDPVKLAWDV